MVGARVDDDNEEPHVSDTEPNELEPSGAGWLQALTDFDWLHIPGAARAIARLVTGAADAANAWIDAAKAKGQQKAQSIRDVTKARSETTRALTRAVSRQLPANKDLLERAENYLVARELQQQGNREAVARETVKLLQSDPPPEETPGPQEDWLNMFASLAEKASSDRMRKHWASVLAGMSHFLLNIAKRSLPRLMLSGVGLANKVAV
jgi:hypothetical protein